MQNPALGPPENRVGKRLSKSPEKWKHLTRVVSRAVLSLVFPQVCSGCGQLVEYPAILCEGCSKELKRLTSPYCSKCGMPFPEQWQVDVCPECCLHRTSLTRLRSAFHYEGVVSALVRDAKYRKSGRILRYFAGELVPWCLMEFPKTIEGLVPVPLHRSREWQRTFNQSERLACYLSRYTGIPVFSLLFKGRETRSQSSLSGVARRANLRGAFRFSGRTPAPRSVLLIDDVVTTGATLNECARVLRRAGARRVYGLTVARALPE